jgi:hypothetical protein
VFAGIRTDADTQAVVVMLFTFSLDQLEALFKIGDVHESRVPLVAAGSILSITLCVVAVTLRLVAHRVNTTRLYWVSRDVFSRNRP